MTSMIKAICDDGFETEVLFGENSTVDDVYNHVLAVRITKGEFEFGPERRRFYAARIQSNDASKGKGRPNKSSSMGSSDVYVLPSMTIGTLFSTQPAGQKHILYLDGFRGRSSPAGVVNDLKVLASKLHEVDTLVKRAIQSHDSSFSLSVSSVRTRVNDSVQELNQYFTSVLAENNITTEVRDTVEDAQCKALL